MTDLILKDYQIEVCRDMINRTNQIYRARTRSGKTLFILIGSQYFYKYKDARRQLILTKSVLVKESFEINNNTWEIVDKDAIYYDVIPAMDDLGIYVMSYDKFRYNWDTLKDQSWDVLYLDESHTICNRSSNIQHLINGGRKKVGENEWRFFPPMKRRQTYLFTGSFIPNRPEQVFSQLKAVGYPGTWTSFKEKFFIEGKTWWNIRLNPSMKGEFFKIINDWSYLLPDEVVEKELNISKKNYIGVPFDIEPEIRREHDMARKDGVFKGEVIGNILTKILRARQIVARSKKRGETFKLLVGRLKSETHKIVFYSFKPDGDDIIAAIEDVSDPGIVRRIDGSVSSKKKSELIAAWKKSGGWLIIQITCGKNGLTLTQAKTVIYYTLEDDDEKYKQSQDRLLGIGQASDVVTYHVLTAKGTVDEVILNSLQKKRNLREELKRWARSKTRGGDL